MMKNNVIVRTAPNISQNAAHYGHALTFLASYWVAESLGGRAIARIDWQLKTKGSMHRNANEYKLKQRQIGFEKILHLAKLCDMSEVIDEYGIRYSLDGTQRLPQYRVFEDEENNIPIFYEYDCDTLDLDKLKEFSTKSPPELARPAFINIDKKLPLIMEHTHVCLSNFPQEYIANLKKLCIETNQLPRRFHKAYCHLEMDRLLGVTHIVRGSDFHSNRVCDVHEKNLNKEWGVPIFPIIKIPLVYSQGEKVSASKEDGIVGLFPTIKADINNMIKTIIKPEYLKYFIPNFNPRWFKNLLTTSNSILDAPIWSNKELVF
jgi:hypothetical protein